MSAPIDPSNDATRPTLSRGFWLMMALSGVSMAGAVILVLMTPKPAAHTRSAAPAPPRAHATSMIDPHADFDDPGDWMEIGRGRHDLAAGPLGAPTEAVEVDDDFGAALQPTGGASLFAETLEAFHALGEWVKGR